jgi:elongator complex protein 2
MRKTTYSILLDAVLMAHDDWVYSVQWRSEGDLESTRLISASADRSAILWKPEATAGAWATAGRLGEMGGNTGGGGFLGALFGPDGNVLAHGLKGSFHLWCNDNHWTPRVIHSGHFASVQDVAWEPHGTFLLSTRYDSMHGILIGMQS